MQTTIASRDLMAALGPAARVACQATSLPVLRNVRLQPCQDGVRVQATDLEISVDLMVQAEASGPAVSLPAKVLAEIVSTIDGDIEFSTQESQVGMSSGGSRFTLRSLAAEDHPSTPAINADRSIVLPAQHLREAIERTVWAASNDKTRPIMAGISFEPAKKSLRLVATNTHVLASCEVQGVLQGDQHNFIVPDRAAREVSRLLSRGGDCLVEYDGSQARFTVSNDSITTRLIEGQFPKWDRVVPAAEGMSVKFDRDAWIACVRRVRITAPATNGTVDMVVLQFGDGEVVFRSEDPELGSGVDRAIVKIKDPWGDQGGDYMGLNGHYLADALASLGGADATLWSNAAMSPIRIQGDDTGWVVIMPMNLGGATEGLRQ